MNKTLSGLQESYARFLEIGQSFQQTYQRHKDNIATLREFIEVEDLVCDELLEQIHNYFRVRRLIESTATLELKSGAIYELPDGKRFIALRKDSDAYLLYDEETGLYSPAAYEITAWGDLVPRVDGAKPSRIDELTSTSEVYFPQSCS